MTDKELRKMLRTCASIVRPDEVVILQRPWTQADAARLPIAVREFNEKHGTQLSIFPAPPGELKIVKFEVAQDG